jgi:hypothetical protein
MEIRIEREGDIGRNREEEKARKRQGQKGGLRDKGRWERKKQKGM